MNLGLPLIRQIFVRTFRGGSATPTASEIAKPPANTSAKALSIAWTKPIIHSVAEHERKDGTYEFKNASGKDAGILFIQKSVNVRLYDRSKYDDSRHYLIETDRDLLELMLHLQIEHRFTLPKEIQGKILALVTKT